MTLLSAAIRNGWLVENPPAFSNGGSVGTFAIRTKPSVPHQPNAGLFWRTGFATRSSPGSGSRSRTSA